VTFLCDEDYGNEMLFSITYNEYPSESLLEDGLKSAPEGYKNIRVVLYYALEQ
jgi:hypothetical protein